MRTEQTARTEVLITVMTYPHPSRGYQGLVCTAGVTRVGEWVRLYPVDYRYRPNHQRFRKYQWISVEMSSRGAGNDGRKESRRPVLDSFEILGPPLPSERGWAARREVIDALPHYTVNQLRTLYDQDKTSLGVVRPTRILDFVIEPAEGEWKPEWQTLFSQLPLFGPLQKHLRKVPFKFSYVFECEDSEKPHRAMIEDWELGVLWLKEVDRLGSEEAANESIKRKFFDETCRADKDTRFFMGTVFPYNTWVVIGTFWPPKPASQRGNASDQGRLF